MAALAGRGSAFGRFHPGRSTDGRAFFYGGRSYPAFLVAAFIWPVGYYYDDMPVGGYLPPPLWGPDNFIEDYGYYGVDAPPPNYSWIRYGPDLLLINLDNGQIAREIRGVFQTPGQTEIASAGRRSSRGDPDDLPGDPPPPGQF